MSEITLTSKITVELIQQCGSDAVVVAAARVSTRGWPSVPEGESAGLIRSLLTSRPAHTLPLEHSLLTVRAHAPAFVWWEWTRHRFQAVDVPGLSFSLESGRYRQLEPVFWVPGRERPLVPATPWKPIRPQFERATDYQHQRTLAEMEAGYAASWRAYRAMLAEGISKEAARAVLGFGVYYAGWASGSLLAWLHFLNRRTRAPGTEAAGFPQYEIAEAARQVEELVKAHWPLTWKVWNEAGRAAP